MTDIELIKIKGGSSVNVTLVNAAVRLINITLELGRTLGTVLRRHRLKRYCKI